MQFYNNLKDIITLMDNVNADQFKLKVRNFISCLNVKILLIRL
jgi:hypothetical protein